MPHPGRGAAHNDIDAALAAGLHTIRSLPVDEDVWRTAGSISPHIKTLDAIHVATCQSAGAHLLTFDATMRSVALTNRPQLAG